MGKTEIILFIILTSIVIAVFFSGVLLFALQYKRKKGEHEKEKESIHESHQKELLSAQLQSQQQVMQHIGREIHDNVGQKLTLASLYTRQLAIATTDDAREVVNSISDIIDESLADLRQLSKTLTNPGLVHASLVALLKDEAARVNHSGICQLIVEDLSGDPVLPPYEKNILFRLLQEFIQNSLKHSGCRSIRITLDRKDDLLLVAASDDGKGFDTSHASGGIGLHNMKRRAKELAAYYQLESTPGRGTKLILQVPEYEKGKI